MTDAPLVDQDGTAAAAFGVPRPSRGADVHLHALPAAGVLPADGSALRGRAEDDRRARRRCADVRLVTVTLDPAFDTPAVLKPYAAAARRRPGDLDVPHRRAGGGRRRSRSQFGIYVEHNPQSAIDITHNLRTAVIDRRRPSGEGPHRQRTGRRPNSLPTSTRLPLPRTDPVDPPALPLTRGRASASIARLRTPPAVQHWLNALPYNTEKGGETLRSFRGVVRTGTAHCLEAALSAAVILEQHRLSAAGPQLRVDRSARSRHLRLPHARPAGDRSRARAIPGLHGRKPVFATPRALALSYVEAYIDFTGRVKAYARRRSARAGRLRLAAVGRRTSGRSSSCCSTGRIGGSRRPTREDRRDAAPLSRASARRTATSRGSTTRAASAGRRCRRSSRSADEPV